ncbi:hypothetical protein J1N35_005084 [Gossypium stocksii]|uniref:Aminotransferase-like plant mobile domain-containing protein n=1 Tax=Gossypium stocksii TaxID=47602 RepID=A0A9D4AIA3_9ROSI|nr:hypothetical protein J1N35_005084 [Gossypium stocksii]
MLATLYQELYWGTEPNKMSIGDCLLLLQSWAWWRLPFLHLRVDTPYTFPLVTRITPHITMEEGDKDEGWGQDEDEDDEEE